MTPSPHETVAKEQRHVILWSVIHISAILCLILGFYYCRQYMLMPDKVIIVDEQGSIYCGESQNILSREVVEDTARRCAVAFLDRSFEHNNDVECEALFGRSAQKSLRDIIGETAEEFEKQKIRQIPEISKVKMLADKPDQCIAYVYGTLHRRGIYMDIPYYQKLNFTLGLRLVRSPDEKTFPLRVLRMTYEEKSIYNDKAEKK